MKSRAMAISREPTPMRAASVPAAVLALLLAFALAPAPARSGAGAPTTAPPPDVPAPAETDTAFQFLPGEGDSAFPVFAFASSPKTVAGFVAAPEVWAALNAGAVDQ